MDDPDDPNDAARLLLAIETATRLASVALLQGDAVLAEREGGLRDHHAERLLPMIDELLDAAGTPLDRVGAFAVSIGPGGFTSLRIGLATVKGLAFGTGVPVAAVPTLEAIAHSALAAGRCEPGEAIVALLDARRGELYAGGYRATGDERLLECVLDDAVVLPDELAVRLRGRVRLVGEGAALLGTEIAAKANEAEVAIDPEPTLWPRAASVGRLGRVRLADGGGMAAGALVPRYLRRAQAEEARTAERFE